MSGMRVMIAGGGTGGHLFPGIAVARELLRRDPGACITFAGTAKGIEARVVPREGFPLDVLRSSGLKGTSVGARLRGLGLLPVSGIDAWHILSQRKPDVVIGVGGYSSGPVVMLAAARGIPTVLLEQNAVPGLTNRLLARVVRVAAVTYETAVPFFGARAVVTGNPVRPEFFAAREEADARTSETPRVLVFGGSQGAHAINVAMVAAAPLLAARPGGVAITHQTGERDLDMVRDGYRRAGLDVRVEPFLYGMEREMSAADLVVCRAGATTLAELTAAGKPALLIPLPTATDDHQRKNADALASAGAAEVLEQSGLDAARLAGRILALVEDPVRLQQMSLAARRLARPDAARLIADAVMAQLAT